MAEDTVIIIPTKRMPPLKTLASFKTDRQVVILADPDVFEEHTDFYYGVDSRTVVQGVRGSIPQALEVYRTAAKMNYNYFFRLDDDLQERFFVHVNGSFPALDHVIMLARLCIDWTHTTLAGFVNSSRRDWLGVEGEFKRGSGLVHGGAQIGRAQLDPEKDILDPALPAYDDVYRSAAHRKRDGAIGVVSWIGLDKRESLRDTTVHKSPEVIAESIRIIMGAFPDMVTCNGTRTLDGGRQVIPNWRMKGRAK